LHNKKDIFLSLLDDHKGIIYKVANSYCANPTDRDDLIQEIVIQIWTSIERYNDQFKWSTWIYRISLNTAISFYRKQKRLKSNIQDAAQVIEAHHTEVESIEDTQISLLRKYIQELRQLDRALILLHLEGLSGQEIASILDTSQSNITTKISRIKKKLRQKFNQHDKSRT